MGLIGSILGGANAVRQVGEAVGGVAEVFVGNQAKRDEMANQQYLSAVSEVGVEFAHAGSSSFDSFVNGLNRLPRPLLALSTLALFGYAMAAPAGFSVRMQGLNLVPEPLWWLLGAIVSFYFGARELHHQRERSAAAALPRLAARLAGDAAAEMPPQPIATPAPRPHAQAAARAIDPDYNAAVEEWRRKRR